jgi:hypothetical protein
MNLEAIIESKATCDYAHVLYKLDLATSIKSARNHITAYKLA